MRRHEFNERRSITFLIPHHSIESFPSGITNSPILLWIAQLIECIPDIGEAFIVMHLAPSVFQFRRYAEFKACDIVLQ
jgi:hypothetical protein